MTNKSEELGLVQQAIRSIMTSFGPSYWRRVDSERAFPEEFFQAMGQAGYYGTLIGEADGGSGAGLEVASVIVEEINRAGGDAAAINAQMAISGVITRVGSAEQKSLLPAIAEGKLRCLGVAATESDSGADMSELKSTARRDGSDWILNAQKIFISMAEHTELLFLLVQAEEGPTLFLANRQDAGERIQCHPVEMLVNRLTTSLFVDDLRLPDSARVGPVGQGLQSLMGGFAPRRILAAAESIGNARFLLDMSLEHARTRQTFDRAIGQNQGVQYPLAQSYAKVEAADLMRWDALRLLASGEDAGGRSALAKILASEAAWETARAAMTTFGGWALTGESHIERKLRECTVFVFNNMLLSYVSHRVLDLPRAF